MVLSRGVDPALLDVENLFIALRMADPRCNKRNNVGGDPDDNFRDGGVRGPCETWSKFGDPTVSARSYRTSRSHVVSPFVSCPDEKWYENSLRVKAVRLTQGLSCPLTPRSSSLPLSQSTLA